MDFSHIVGEEGSVLCNVVKVLGLQSVSREFVSHFFLQKMQFCVKNVSIILKNFWLTGAQHIKLCSVKKSLWLMIWGWRGEMFDILIYVGMYVGQSQHFLTNCSTSLTKSLLRETTKKYLNRAKIRKRILKRWNVWNSGGVSEFSWQTASLLTTLPPSSPHLLSPAASWTLLLLPLVSCSSSLPVPVHRVWLYCQTRRTQIVSISEISTE